MDFASVPPASEHIVRTFVRAGWTRNSAASRTFGEVFFGTHFDG